MDRLHQQTLQTEMRAPQPMPLQLPAKALPVPASAPQIQGRPAAPWPARHLPPPRRGAPAPCPGWMGSPCQSHRAQPQCPLPAAAHALIPIADSALPERLAGHFGLKFQVPLPRQIPPGYLLQRAAPAPLFPAGWDPVPESLAAWPCAAPHWHSTQVWQVRRSVMRAPQVLPVQPVAAVLPFQGQHDLAPAHRAMAAPAPAPQAPQAQALGGIPTNPDRLTTAAPAAHSPGAVQDRAREPAQAGSALGQQRELQPVRAACRQKKACPAWAAAGCAPYAQPPHRCRVLRTRSLHQILGPPRPSLMWLGRQAQTPILMRVRAPQQAPQRAQPPAPHPGDCAHRTLPGTGRNAPIHRICAAGLPPRENACRRKDRW